MSNIHKKGVLIVVLALIAVQLVWAVAYGIQPAKAQSKTLIVPDNYPTIGTAIGNATRGDTILVRAGTYFENPVVDKSITLISEVPRGAIVNGTGGLPKGAKGVFTITASNVTLQGFTIESSKYTPSSNGPTAVMLYGDNCTIKGNTFLGTYYGLFATVTFHTTITENNVVNIGKNGIKLCGGAQNIISNNFMTGNIQSGAAIDGYADLISGNTFVANGLGLGLAASYSVVFGNNFTDNTGNGIYFGASDCVVSSNIFVHNVWGVSLSSDFAAPSNDTFYQNNFVNNTALQVNSKSNGFAETWDNGITGNYWSDYNGSDVNGDGVGDVSYAVSANNTDNLPLMNPIILGQGVMPSMPAVPNAPVGTIASWNFDNVTQDGMTPDSVDSNQIILDGDDISSMHVATGQGCGVQFNGTSYGFVAPSSTLNVHGEVTVDAWVNVQQFKNVSYNNIFVESARTTESYPTRIWGFAINGIAPSSSSQPVLGALRGFMLDSNGVFSEIDTTTPIPLNQWVHVIFVRNQTDGMHIYMNGVEQNVTVLSGSQNPTGTIAQGTECYIGHDSYSTLDSLSISNVAVQPAQQPIQQPTQPPNEQPLWAEWWFWAVTAAVFVAFFASLLFLKRAVRTKTL